MTQDDVETRLRNKLNSGEITQEEFDELYEKFKNLGMLDAKTPPKTSKRKSWSFTGSKTVDGDATVDGPVSVTGSLQVTGSLNCQTLSIAGSTKIDGDLLVKQKVNLTGKLEFNGSGKIGGPLSIAGKLETPNDLIVTNIMKTAGKADIGNELVVANTLKIGGKVTANTIKCQEEIRVGGSLSTKGDVIAAVFKAPLAGHSQIGGNLKARLVKIGSTRDSFNIKIDEKLNGMQDIATFVTKVVSSFVPGATDENTKPFVVLGDVVGDDIELAYTTVHGNVIGKNVKVGDNVVIEGVIRYSGTLDIPEGSTYTVENLSD